MSFPNHSDFTATISVIYFILYVTFYSLLQNNKQVMMPPTIAPAIAPTMTGNNLFLLNSWMLVASVGIMNDILLKARIHRFS